MAGQSEILTLKCVRCGDTHQREVGDPYTPELCGSCFSKGLEILLDEGSPFRRYDRWTARWQKGSDKHPTTAILREAWVKWQGAA